MTQTTHLIEQDKKHRQLALDPRQSFIVQAPAGSGKTELLIQRFLTLLTQVKIPEEILAITFTKKAANEMRSRIIKALKQAEHEAEPESAHAKQTWKLARQVLQRDQQQRWHLINNPNQLRIQTIDSLCAYLTRQLPLLSHFGSQPDIADHPVFLYREAVQEVLMHVEENLEWSPAISQLLLHLDNDLNKLHDLLVSLLAKRDQWVSYIQLDTSDHEIKKRLEHHLALVISTSIQTLREKFPADLPHPQSADKAEWLAFAESLLTKNFTWRKRVPNQSTLMTMLNKLSEREDIRLALTDLFFLPEPCYQEAQWQILKALLMVLKVVAAQLRVTFQQHGQIDFIENAQAALLALGNDENPTDLALALDYQIKHILVDEFQDTAFTQYQLLEKLIMGWETGDGRTLFVVGDPMQSIYRFREAEVGLFIRMCKNGLGHIKLTPLTLAVNFRSTAKIVEWNNAHFQHIFPPSNDIASGAVAYSPSVSPQSKADDHSAIEIKGFFDEVGQAQANHIVALVQETKKNHPDEKIAILVRSRSYLESIIPALKKANISYRAVDIDSLASRQSIQDLLSLTCALLHPADRIAWLAILRAPWCGLTLADLLIIAGKDPYATIWEQLNRDSIRSQLSADGQQRVNKILPILRNKIAERERENLRAWVENTWLLLGGPACLSHEDDMNDAKAYFELLEEFSQRHPIINLDKLKEKMEQLYASAQQDETTLQIMTIHTAKGLEFDTVILPHLGRKIPSDDKSLLSWMEQPLTDDQVALLLAPIHATGHDSDATYEYIHRQQRIKSKYETDRLLYVATTRAKKRLYLFFDAVKKDNGDIKVESGSFLEKLWPLLDHKLLAQEIPTSPSGLLGMTGPRYMQRISSSWHNPFQAMHHTTIAFHAKQNGFQLTDHTSRLIGTVTHRILQQVANAGIDWWKKNNKDNQLRYIHQQLLQAGLLPQQLENSSRAIQTMIDKVIKDARGAWILSPHAEAACEFAISAVIEGKVENLVIDRTFIDDGIRWIIDYKTTTFLSEEKYLEKMQQYYRAMQLMDDRPIRLGLYFPALLEWKELTI
ncbi:MAG: hypothetical protein EPO11_00900 [Gammaproteobacteria bacterium]|nr:MAG: hypothetical protein EPO11_00900 [Gammaproteobacteria bacterium]